MPQYLDLDKPGGAPSYETLQGEAARALAAEALKAPLISPALTGTPTAPTPTPGTNTTQIATMAALKAAIDAAIAALVNGAPGALDTLAELAAQLGNDESAASVLTNRITQEVTDRTTAIAALQVLISANTTALATKTDKTTSVLSWIYDQSFRLVNGTRNSNGALTSATIEWPDGATGTFTADTLSTAFPGAIDAYHVTRTLSGTTTTYTQPAVTRDTNGAVTAQPAIAIS